ncbi:AcrR family transcriptional regulator [Actinoalloteichus hoggarensis]|uniref:Putative HTH-type transcriptional regulator TtgW n=1 Tax=Actinoalloteichus hoggarensis TaxID=1470176 RepID=A0A221VZC2_9PSEU|nr:TetR/AcrR family transcriptional regulator [Actinoalloteichus hoggarensis]ASO18866.1 putative HTH-type transcriptional regulator TtgW [Actinoalloteichus hoggarensis]MBB5920101.1 AcrR family transcriptional regulator [Actinoalloteichus hoggarensis]
MSARERILDAAAEVMQKSGVAATTTRQIARAAGCSEALLYKHFAHKQELFVAVLNERLPRLSDPRELAGTRTVAENLATLVEQLLAFYLRSFPMAASVFSSPSLRDAHRNSLSTMGAGPDQPARLLQTYLEIESRRGRLAPDTDCHALARVLTGAALFEAFQASYAGADEIDDAGTLAARIVAVVGTDIGGR